MYKFRSNPFPVLIIFTFIITFITTYTSSSVSAQEQIDPFYTNLLHKGVQSFVAGNYKDAVKELELANFGLYGRDNLMAKACIYLGLSYYYLKDNVKSEKYLRDAENLLGDKGFQSIDMDDSARAVLQKLLLTFKMAEPPPPPPIAPMLKKNTKKPAANLNLIRELERKIKAKPKDVPLYYDLYALHMENNKQKDALKTLRNLLKKNPDEFIGYHLSGKIQYHLRKCKDAEKSFTKLFELSRKSPIAERILIESRAYLILCAHIRRDKKRESKIAVASLELFTKDAIDSLNLAERDKVLLHTIIENYKNKQN